MRKMMLHEALDALKADNYLAWAGDESGVFLARTKDSEGLIQFDDRVTMFGLWDGQRGTDGALLTTENGDVYNECGGIVSKGNR